MCNPIMRESGWQCLAPRTEFKVGGVEHFALTEGWNPPPVRHGRGDGVEVRRFTRTDGDGTVHDVSCGVAWDSAVAEGFWACRCGTYATNPTFASVDAALGWARQQAVKHISEVR